MSYEKTVYNVQYDCFKLIGENWYSCVETTLHQGIDQYASEERGVKFQPILQTTAIREAVYRLVCQLY